MSFIKLIKSLLSFSLSFNEKKFVIKDFYNDSCVRLDLIKFERHLLFIAGLPKSGTTWLEQLFNYTPGLVQLNKSRLRKYPSIESLNLKHSHYIHPEMLSCAPKNLLSFLKLHLDPHPENLNILEESGIKTVVLIRDIRDMLISRYYHVMNDQNHWDYERLKNISSQSRLIESMKAKDPESSMLVIEYYNYWINGWLGIIKDYPENYLLIKYEEMNSNLFFVIKSILKFYGIELSDSSIRKIIHKNKKVHSTVSKSSLSENLNKVGREQSTFRKGVTGEWRSLFNQELIDYVKIYSAETLINSGYEKDHNW